MSARTPDEIWEEGLDEGERRLTRSVVGLAASGFAGGVEVGLGILAVTVVNAAVTPVAPEQLTHVISATVFGIAFVFITIGRAELFTENFHIPVGAVFARRAPVTVLGRMWLVTLVFNLIGLAVILGPLSVHDVLLPATQHAAGPTATLYGERDLLPSFISAVVAGTVITLFTWAVAAAETSVTRVMLSLITGFLLVAPSLNHAVVGFGKILFGIFTHSTTATSEDLWRNLGVSIAGNMVGGIGLVFTTRVAQVRGEPDAEGSARRPAAA